MPAFICPIKNCKHYSKKKENCKKEFVSLISCAGDWTVLLDCPHQENKEKKHGKVE